jgi:molybdopterin-guanine dinucleotide biosynthesis protein A
VEPDEERHPLLGLRHALACARPHAVLVCAQDLPFVTAELLRSLCAAAAESHAHAVVAAHQGQMQPLLGWYGPAAAAALSAALAPLGPLRETISALNPLLIEVEDPMELFNVNAPEDVLRASALLDARRGAVRPAPPAPLNRT